MRSVGQNLKPIIMPMILSRSLEKGSEKQNEQQQQWNGKCIVKDNECDGENLPTLLVHVDRLAALSA
jgi:hypothetical protein